MDVKTPPPAILPPTALSRLPLSGALRTRAGALVARMRNLNAAQWIWISAGGVLALFFIWMLWPSAEAVDVAVIDRGLVRREIVDEGRTRIHDVFVVAAPVGGALQRIELEPGDSVERDQVIATIAPASPALLDARVAAEASARVEYAQAAVRAAEAQHEFARNDQGRIARLHAGGFASPAALDAANAALRAARSSLAAARAELTHARVAAGREGDAAQTAAPVRSPISGRVLRLLQESETTVPAGAPLMEIGDLRDLEIVSEFLSQDAISIRPGAAASIENWGGDTPIPARVSRIEPYAHTRISALGVEEQRVNVIARLSDPARAPPLGHAFRVDLRIIASEQVNALRVPTDALVRDGADWAAFRIVGGRARLTRLTLGEGGDTYRAVRAGLSEGDRVVLFPGDALEDGDSIRPSKRQR